jgi:acyl transferase domain-containing protein
LDFFVLFSSLASTLGGFGQVDYAGANAFLDAFSHHKKSTDGTFTTSINWDAWQEVGMAAEATQQFEKASDITKTQLKPVTHPLFEQCLVEGSEREIYISKLNVSKHWVLNEHRFKGKPILPGTAYLEMARAAAENHANNRTIELRQVYFLSPLIVEEDEEKEIHTVLKKKEDGFEFLIMSQFKSESDEWQTHVTGEITYRKLEDSEKVEIKKIESECNQQEINLSEQGYRISKGSIGFGERWNNCKWLKLGNNQGLAFLELPELFTADLKSYKLHPALLDYATGFLMIHFKNEGETYLPFSYKSLKIKGDLQKQVYSYIRTLENQQPPKETLTFNITIMDDQGTELIEIEEYTLRMVNEDIS